MKKMTRLLTVLLAVLLAFSAFSTPVGAALDEPDSAFGKVVMHTFFHALDKLILALGKFLNTFIPGLDWVGKVPLLKEYTPTDFYPGKAHFDAQSAEGATWSMGFSSASFLDGTDPMDGKHYLVGTLSPFKGDVPQQIIDDQGVNTCALSDGETTVTFSAIDGYGLARGDVQEIRRRLADFAKEHGIDSINVSALHQHSCIDTLGLGVPLIPGLINNPASILFFGGRHLASGRNPEFMEIIYQRVTETVMEAVNSMREGTLSYGYADIDDLSRDKRDPRVVEGEIQRLRFVPNDASAREIWLCEAGIHAVTLMNDHVLSADYPHYLERYVNEHANADVVYVLGAELAIARDAGNVVSDPEDGIAAGAIAYGEELGRRLVAIENETPLAPLINIAFSEVTIPVKNPVHILAAREGLLGSVMCRDGSQYYAITELGYMELGGKLGFVLVPGEVDPAMLWGGAVSAEDSWLKTAWTAAPWAQVCGAQKLICFGVCNDQIGYILCDNDYRSMLSENEEINAVSPVVGSLMTEEFSALIARVKG